ncbi:MAG: hypothetical protein II574_06295 [Ruminococcus sp.]|nr:hypothetical protein [Ruminococcus sp.]
MLGDFDDDGFGLFSDDPQEQFFGYYYYTQMTGDDPLELFDDELPQDNFDGNRYEVPPRADSPQGAFRSSSYRPTGKVQPHTQRYADYLKNRRPKSRFSLSGFISFIGILFFIALVIYGVGILIAY